MLSLLVSPLCTSAKAPLCSIETLGSHSAIFATYPDGWPVFPSEPTVHRVALYTPEPCPRCKVKRRPSFPGRAPSLRAPLYREQTRRPTKNRGPPVRESTRLLAGETEALALNPQLFKNQLTHASGICLAAGCLHDLADHSTGGLDLTGTNLIGNVGHSGQSLIDGGSEG